jgi:hypothetical protein
MKRPLGYLDGLGTGVAAIALVVAAYLSSASAQLGDMYRELNATASWPSSTKLVLSSAWQIGVPLALVGALVGAHVWRPRYALIAIALLAIAVDVFWYLAAWAPVFQVAGNIR